MNERIRELADQADLQPYYNAQEAAIKKFAELIVRECVNQVDEFSRLTKAYQAQGIDPEIDVAKEVLKNFGVEE